MTPDLINAVFELSGAVLTWLSVARLYRDKKVRGVYWPAMALFATWGGWNLIYYPVLGQWVQARSLQRSARRASRRRAIGFSLQYSVVIQRDSGFAFVSRVRRLKP